MRIVAIFIFLFMACLPIGAKTPNIRVNGVEVYNKVTEITFDDNGILMRWNDNSTSSDACCLAILKLINSDHINDAQIFAVSGVQNNDMLLQGLVAGSTLYIYNLQGVLLMRQNVTGEDTQVNLSNLNTGIYLLKNGNTFLKFVKR
jgi:hypothetical protein